MAKKREKEEKEIIMAKKEETMAKKMEKQEEKEEILLVKKEETMPKRTETPQEEILMAKTMTKKEEGEG